MSASCVTQSQSVHNVFVYGSLLADDVVKVLLKRIPPSSSASLNGFDPSIIVAFVVGGGAVVILINHRFSIKGRVYPAILPVENKKVTGKVLFGITNSELDILDTFEDVEYERRTVEVSVMFFERLYGSRFKAYAFPYAGPFLLFKTMLMAIPTSHCVVFDGRHLVANLPNMEKDNSEKLQAHTYVWTDKNDPNLYGDWDFEEWKGVHMNDFIKMTTGFVEELELPESKPRVTTYESFYKQDGQ